MGLDMYLYRAEKNTAERHDSDYEFCDCLKCRPKLKWIEEQDLGYWRKANAIHNWFVTNLADGVDECQQIQVSVADLFALREACQTELRNKPDEVEDTDNDLTIHVDDGNPERLGEILADIFSFEKMAKDMVDQPQPTEEHPLPPTTGFFFGSTARDEGYYEDLKHTESILQYALSIAGDLDEDEAIIYQASW